ncbi:hypothetical protein C0J52_01938 [Blattella germanica]|nr:hypothetical protein C0J52_01938 [Blattella germanica]
MHTHSTVARPLPLSGEEVVISGISGCYPESGNVREFQENLFNKVDMITDDDRRWKADNSGVPHRTGKVPVVNKFDAAFFGSSALQAKALDPQNRLLMEKTCEALLDAGINPTHLKGKNVGVFIGMSFVEAERAWQFESPLPDGISYTHTARGLIASRISRFYGINGPCHIVDTACSSSMYAFDCALKAIHDGRCDSAFICTTTLCLLQNPSFHFWRLGVINSEGKCKCFDNEGNGYARSETVVAFYVQKAKDAKRVYASVVHIKTNCDGYKEQGITFPSAKIQGRLLEDFYQECSVDPTSVHFVEAHATGTKVGDPEEISALDKVFCKGRKEPLLIGSVKSNMGHTEPGSALVSMTKVLITMETGFIPPNINFNSPREGVEALETGRMKVVTDKHPYDKSLIAVNSFGFGGANGHCLLRRNEKVKQNGGVPEDPLPRLVLVAGRVKESVEVTLRDFENRPVDAEYVYLMNDLHSSEIPGFLYRGYSLLTEDNKKPRNIQRHAAEHKRPVWFVFPGLCSLHSEMGKSLMQIPTFSEAISKCEKTLKEFGVNVKDIITSDDPNIFNNIVNCFVGNAAYQVGLVDIIKKVGIEPDGLIGYSVGELGCSYMDGSLTAQQVMLVAYYQGYALAQTKTLKGLMLTVGMFYMLQTQGHSVKVVNSANTFFHNTCASACTASLLRSLQKVIPNPKPRSPFWKSTSVPESAWHSPKATFSSAEYHTNVLSSAVLFEEASRHIPDDAITIEITPNGQQLNIQSRSLFKQIQNVALTKENHPDAVQNLFSSLGDFISCKPSNTHDLATDQMGAFTGLSFVKSRERTVKINLGDLEMAYLGGHVIDGRVLYPAMGYVVLVWECMAFINSLAYEDMDVVFDNLQFEISESGASVVTGTIRVPNDISREWLELDPPQDVTGEDDVDFSSRDIYKELRLRGYNYQGQFRSIVSANAAGSKGKIRWFDNWVAHMDNMLQMQILQEDTRGLFVPISIGKLTINTSKHHALLSDLKKEMEQPEIPVYVHKDMNIIRSGGVEIRALIASAITKRKPLGEPVVEKHLFVPFIEPDQLDVKDALRVCVHMMLENVIGIRVKAVEVYNEDAAPFSPELAVILGDLPLIQADITLLANQPLQDIESVGFKINNSVLSEEEKCLLVIVSNTMDNNELLETALKVIAEGGFILVRERSDFQSSLFTKRHGIEAVFVKSVDNEKLVLFRKTAVDSPSVIIKICSSNYDWLPKLQAAVASSSKQSILLVAQNDPLCGILGLVNCILKESNGHDVRHWGTYRHLPIKDFPLVKVPNAYVNVTTRGDLSSLTWIQGKRVCDIPESERVHVYYSALNFKDVMTATGKIPLEVAAKFRLSQDNVQGLEYSGRDVNGRRVMGMVGGGATATMLHADKNLMWNVPDHWTLEDAATVPVVYGTAYFALLMCGDMKKGESILIHAGSGGVGMAAIHICLHAGCTQTNGRGVDLVLNSLAEEKLQASLRCLAVGGRFLEIGKADLSKNNPIPMEIILKGVSFHGIGLDYYFWATHKEKHALNDILTEGIKSGACILYMAAGKHIGKVLLKITTEEPEKIIRPVPKVVEARAHYHCIPDSSYIIAGGLGGFGLELADWLVLRGARKLILTTHSGLKNGYQSSRIRVWRSYGVEVLILRDDITTESGVKSLLMKATDLGPVAAIFNLAVVSVSIFILELKHADRCDISRWEKRRYHMPQNASRQGICPLAMAINYL